MAWNASLAQRFDWPHLLGYHLNVAASAMTPAAEIARVHPSSPECVWAGDVGVPERLRVTVDFERTGSIANPDWSAAAPAFETVFCLFVDELEARELLPALWLEPAPVGVA